MAVVGYMEAALGGMWFTPMVWPNVAEPPGTKTTESILFECPAVIAILVSLGCNCCAQQQVAARNNMLTWIIVRLTVNVQFDAMDLGLEFVSVVGLYCAFEVPFDAMVLGPCFAS